MSLKAIALLEVMWDWEARTSEAGYQEIAPRWFHINPANLTGSRLYYWLGEKGVYYSSLLVTNACPQLVSSASGRGTPDRRWVRDNLKILRPYDVLIVCGRVARETYGRDMVEANVRVIEVPHPAARMWSSASLGLAGRYIREYRASMSLEFRDGKLIAKSL